MYIYIYWRGGTVLGGPLSNPTQQRKQPSRSSMALMSLPCPRTLRCPRLPIREIAQNPRFFLCVEIIHVRIFVHTHPLCVSFVCEYAIVRFYPEECVRLCAECTPGVFICQSVVRRSNTCEEIYFLFGNIVYCFFGLWACERLFAEFTWNLNGFK